MPKLINLLAYDLIDKIIAYIHEHHLTPGTKLPRNGTYQKCLMLIELP